MAKNYTEQAIKTAFGKNQFPSWADLESFLEERCIPRQRGGLREYLETLGGWVSTIPSPSFGKPRDAWRKTING